MTPLAVGTGAADRLHLVLLGLAGRLDDLTLTTARALLAAGLAEAAAAVVLDTVLERGTVVNPAEARVLLDGAPLVPGLVVGATPDVTACSFSRPAAAPGADLARGLPAVVAEHGVVGVWRAVRSGAGAERCVHLLEVDETVCPQRLTGELQAWLVAAGEDDPQVEVVRAGLRPPAYHRALKEHGERLHPVGLRMARLFDGLDVEGRPRFAAEHPLLDPAQVDGVLRRLRCAPVVLAAASLAVDVVSGGDPRVPLGFRTDGTFVWCDAVAWYLEHHGLAPDPDLLRHLGSGGPPVTTVDPGALREALRVVFGG